MNPNEKQLEHCYFAIGNKPYCVWGYNLRQANRDFLKGIDHEYFDYLARTYSKDLEGSDKNRAIIALRTSYYHGLETLFSLLFSGLQAPECTIAWILKAQSKQVREIVKLIGTTKCDFPINLSPAECTWEGISERINGILFRDRPNCQQLQKNFANLWRRFAKDYTDGLLDKEYNSFKHGFRMRLGGERFLFAPSKDPTKPPPPEKYMLLAESKLGSFFFAPEQIEGSPVKMANKDPHFWLKEHHVNSHPTRPDLALMLISISLNNIRAFLRIINGDYEETGIKILYPLNEAELTAPWENPCSLSRSTTSQMVVEQQIERMSEKEILERLRCERIKQHIS